MGKFFLNRIGVLFLLLVSGAWYFIHLLIIFVLNIISYSGNDTELISYSATVAILSMYIIYGAYADWKHLKQQKKFVEDEHKKIYDEISSNLSIERKKLECERYTFEGNMIIENEELDNKKLVVENLMSETSQSYPWLASKFADSLYIYDKNLSKHLATKKRPALSASEEVSRIAKEKRELQKMCKMQEYQLNFYETLFPWLEDFKELEPIKAWEYISKPNAKDEYETLKTWISPEEYHNLPVEEKYQLALDRYKSKNKSNWEIGIEFERYIGYLYETEGYIVKYLGATLGFEDMGRDLLASKGKENIVIQCKRWSKNKTIHEKHIFQLYGSMVMLGIQNPNKKYTGYFVTTTSLSDTAKSCADFLNITYQENCDVKNYPLIKCNISSNGEKIFHLPFDQQYDNIIINFSKGERYSDTVERAIALGFRRAKKWVSVSQ